MGNRLNRHKTGRMSFFRGGDGEPFLLLHGIPGSAFVWEAAGELLVNRFQVIIPDLLGFGESDIPTDDYYVESQAVALRQLLDDLSVKGLYLGGHDFGGPIAVTLVRLFPELRVNGLVLSATNMFTDTYVPPPLRVAKVPFLNTLVFKAMAGNRVGLRMMHLAATKERQEASWEKFKRHLTPSGISLTWRIFQRSLADLKTNYQAVEETLPQIGLRTLVLWGDSDPFFSVSIAERVHHAIKNSTLKVYNNTGHFVPEERPGLVANDIASFFGQRGR